MIMAYARAYALCFAKAAYATLQNPGFCLRDPSRMTQLFLKSIQWVHDDPHMKHL